MVCEPDCIGSEIFERLRSSKYTPHNINHPPAGCFISGRVIFGALCGGTFYHSTGCSLKSGVGGRFSSPLRNSECLTVPIHRTTLPQSRPLGVTAPSEREPGMAGVIHPGACETVGLRAIFIAPTKLREFYIPPSNRVLAKILRYGRFSSPLRKRHFTVPCGGEICLAIWRGIRYNLGQRKNTFQPNKELCKWKF